MESLFLHSIGVWHPALLAVVFVGMLFEGDGIVFATAFLVHRGTLPFGGAFLLILAGVIIGDYAWFMLGRKLHRDGSWACKWVRRLTAPLESSFHRRPGVTIFISKFLYGVNHAILVRAGMLGIDQATFLKYNSIASILWILIVGGLGYAAGASVSLISHRVRVVELGLVLGLFILFGVEYIARKLSVATIKKTGE